MLSYSSNNNSYYNISSYNNSNSSSRNSSNRNSSCNHNRCTCRFHQWTITPPSCQQSTRHTITTNTNS